MARSTVGQRTGPRRPAYLRLGKKLRPFVNRLAARASLLPDQPLLDQDALAWTAAIRARWTEIRDEALAVRRGGLETPPLRAVSPDHARIAADDSWRSFFLVGYGARIDENRRAAPITAALVEAIPGLNSAFFSILEPGCHIPRHKGVTKGLLTWHLGLAVPRAAERCRMALADETLVWRDGKSFLFDDTYRHEVWNDTGEDRVILLVQVDRPMRGARAIVPRLFLWGVRRSAFVRDATANLRQLARSAQRPRSS